MTSGRAPTLVAIIAISVLAWAYVIWLAGAMDMTGVDPSSDMSGMIMPAFKHWTLTDAGFMAVMWAVMMVAMMLPSAAPMILLYQRVGKSAALEGQAFGAPAWFTSGYLAAWLLFAAAATFLQWVCEQAALVSPGMSASSRAFGAALLVVAGVYQWTPLKEACLVQCQTPMNFLRRHAFRGDPRGALVLGLRHGLYCIGCCWALMALLFVGGIMNLLWIAGLAALVLVEKLLPANRLFSRSVGVAMIAGAALLLI
jgi:predicted metal-binding membrane protein